MVSRIQVAKIYQVACGGSYKIEKNTYVKWQVIPAQGLNWRICLRKTYWNNIGENCGHINTWYLLRINLNVTVDAICHWHVQIK